MLIGKKDKIDLPCPYESSALSISATDASCISCIGSEAPITGKLPHEPILPAVMAKLEDIVLPHERADEVDGHSPAFSDTDAIGIGEVTPNTEIDENVKPAETSQLASDDSYTVRACCSLTSHSFNGAELTVQYTVGTDISESRNLRYRVRRLNEADVEALHKTNIKLYTASSIEMGAEITLPTTSPFYLDMGSAIVKLVLYN